ncbi:anthranilate phosphoribosyltransferase [Caldivirga maquilingensis]|uniref:Anthranilate phosphoribosyltransferase n=1 Tax=Caldivirga maquilingensis (strain ATCC 700844 / DSM 13496 / JCM 10307 / IC-167) TaxID=397948 RepID=TRPD_CALMQ|nr:anthranilate phosphoribosyltransferase [Caldivirga maquilingensis]A8MDL8.1 RecName: Full=Anthranilate phosphoribosyltransferase [Caldivirga maquilingensis IC-167]ABW01874.1 anthranilate phosphoribosyltransferase [Caldivirga maquilingensis IC-167]
MRPLLEKIARGLELSLEEAYNAALAILKMEAGEAETAALLMGLRVRGERAFEVAGFAKALRETCLRIPVNDPYVIDTAGTGGDGLRTMNVSTISALLAAYLGVKVLKHGNRSVSSSSGSADFLEALGFNISVKPETALLMLNNHRFSFAFAPMYHPAMKNVMPVRRRLGIRTIFNLVGPLANPGLVRRQVLGVAEAGIMGVMAEAAGLIGYDHLLLVHGEPGIDEVSVFGRTMIYEVKGNSIDKYVIEPPELGLRIHELRDVVVSNPMESIEKAKRGLMGVDEAALDFIAANTAMALYVAGKVKDPRDGVEAVKQIAGNSNDFWSYVNNVAAVSRRDSA